MSLDPAASLPLSLPLSWPLSWPRWLLARRWLAMRLRDLLLLSALAAAATPSFGEDPYSPVRAWSDAPTFASFNQWSIVPLSGARLEGQARLDSRQEFKFSTVSTRTATRSGSTSGVMP